MKRKVLLTLLFLMKQSIWKKDYQHTHRHMQGLKRRLKLILNWSKWNLKRKHKIWLSFFLKWMKLYKKETKGWANFDKKENRPLRKMTNSGTNFDSYHLNSSIFMFEKIECSNISINLTLENFFYDGKSFRNRPLGNPVCFSNCEVVVRTRTHSFPDF